SAGALATAFGALELIQSLAHVPERQAEAAVTPPDVQFDFDAFIPPAFNLDGIPVRFGAGNVLFATARLSRTPDRADQRALEAALPTIERAYPWSPAGVFLELSYGLPYFRRFDRGLVARTIPRLRSDTRRSVLEEAVVAPTDVHPTNPG